MEGFLNPKVLNFKPQTLKALLNCGVWGGTELRVLFGIGLLLGCRGVGT